MRKALTFLGLLLILTAVSSGSGTAWAASSAQGFVIQENPPATDTPPVNTPDDEFECLGDPDDAITGNRSDGATDDGFDFGTFSGMPDVDDVGSYEEWFALFTMLLYLGLI